MKSILSYRPNAIQVGIAIPALFSLALSSLLGASGVAVGALLAPIASPIVFLRYSKHKRQRWKKVGLALALSGSSFVAATATGLAGYEMIFKKAQPVAYMKEKQQQQQHAKAELARVEREKADRIRSEHAKAEQAKAEQLRLEVEKLKLERSNQVSRQNQSGRTNPSTARTSASPGNQVSARPDNVSPKPSPAKQNLSQKVNTEQKLKELASLGILKKDLPLFCSWQDACISAHLANAQPLKTLNSRAISKAISQAKEKGQSQKLISLLVARLSMAKKEEDRQARIRAEEESKQAEIKRLASIIDGTYIPTESEITRPCKELAEENSVTGQIDWGWFGVANAQYNREQRLVTLEGRSKNSFGVKIPFTIMCQWEKGGVVRVVDIKHGHGG